MRKFILAAALLVPVITFVSNVVSSGPAPRAAGGYAVTVQDGMVHGDSVKPDGSVLDPLYKKLGK